METTDIRKFQNRTFESIRVLAFFKAKPGKGKELEEILLELIPLTRSEPGNIAYILHRSTKDPDELLFDEIFTSQDEFEEHNNRPYIRNLGPKIEHLLVDRIKVETYRDIAIG